MIVREDRSEFAEETPANRSEGGSLQTKLYAIFFLLELKQYPGANNRLHKVTEWDHTRKT